MKRLVCLVTVLVLLLSGCSGLPGRNKQYSKTYLNLFDTVTTVVGYAESEAAFDAAAQQIHDELQTYHRLFDIYNDYEGLNNLKTVNDQAGIAPVSVDGQLIALLKDCKSYYELTGGRVNIAMGGVLQLWHEARTSGLEDPEHAALPDKQALLAAGEHVDPDAVVIDETAGTVYISDPLVQLDVGAVAKGWAAQRVAEAAPQGLLISVGGNVCATGPKDEDGTPWTVAVQDPDDGSGYLHTVQVSGGSVVTSGDYQRAYTVDGELYHHIIDPDTLYPSRYWRSVTILCADSGLADALSTALFLLPREAGQALLERCEAEAMWLDRDGQLYYSPGFPQ